MDNTHTEWVQSHFVNQPEYDHWPQSKKVAAQRDEKRRVKPYPLGNAIAVCPTTEEAKWIAERLNLAAKLEAAWHPSSERPEEGRIVWIIERHHKEIKPQSYAIHGGTVGDMDSETWIVEQFDEAGMGGKYWKPEEHDPSFSGDLYCAWAYADELTILPPFV